ncbi:MAG TPA: TatD family deoxyribonuclease, partial [Nitrospirales bacterium]|nr:TatD family deoxyribonuclease [Nitrospirales bacterium]
MLVDTHTHIHDPRFDADREAVIKRARTAGVDVMITVGTDLATSRAAIALAKQHSFIYATVGVHPHEVKDLTSEILAELRVLAEHPRVVAYGEIGLDYYYDHSPRDIQRERFKDQLSIARTLDLPVVVHTRD